MLCLRQRELLSEPGTMVTEITLDHEFLMSSYSTASERALSRFALDMHPGRDLKVLVGGLGLGYTAHEVSAVSKDKAGHHKDSGRPQGISPGNNRLWQLQ